MQTLDARNLMCPLPVIRAQDAIATMKPGEKLKVFCTDPGALNDIPAWCRINGHEVISMEQSEREITIVVAVGSDA